MTLPGIRGIALLSALAAAFALGLALASEHWGGLVPCALCLLERWPYRVAIVLGLLAAVVPHRWARALLVLVVLSMLVERGAGGRACRGRAALVAKPAAGMRRAALHRRLDRRAPGADAGAAGKPCEDATYLIPGLPISMAAMNLLYALVFAVAARHLPVARQERVA